MEQRQDKPLIEWPRIDINGGARILSKKSKSYIEKIKNKKGETVYKT